MSLEQQDGLNPQQTQAVSAGAGPILVLAGPGSGKTRVLTQRIAFLIRQREVDPYQILAVTFTNKAAREMRERLTHDLGARQVEWLTVGTFHAICARWLRHEAHHIGRSRDFVIYDADDQERLVKRILREQDLDEKRNPPRAVLARISSAKNELVGVEEYRRLNRTYFDEIVGRCYQRYQALLQEANALDFDDLLGETVRLFREQPEVLARYQQRYGQILVDEYQDTNRAQYTLIKLLAGTPRNLFVVGDDAQSIYGWRGADIRNILQFEQDYPDAQVILLEQNYRSTQTILDCAQALIAAGVQHRHRKRLWTDNAEGLPVTLYEAYDETEEAALITAEILRLRETTGATPAEFAVMYRTNAQSRAVEEALIRAGIAYQLIGGTKFYERREVRDLMAYLRVISNSADSISLLRIINWPGRGIGESSLTRLLSYAAEQERTLFQAITTAVDDAAVINLNGRARKALQGFVELLHELFAIRDQVDLVDLITTVIERLDFRKQLLSEYGDEEGESRWENIVELREKALAYSAIPREEQLSVFLQDVALIADVDNLEAVDRVTCITLHQAKGLEYRYVFLIGLEEGLLPHSRSLDDRDQLEEERRLLYVGMTRARQRLYLSYALRRSSYGRTNSGQRSRFLNDLPAALIKRPPRRPAAEFTPTPVAPYSPTAAAPRRSTAAPAAAVVDVFDAGEQVYHATFGLGTVISCRPIDGDAEVVVRFGEKERRLLAGFARLERRS